MAKDVIELGEVAARGTRMIEIRCGRCDQHGRLSVARLLAQFGAGAATSHVMRVQIGECPNRDSTQIYDRCDPYCPTLAQLFDTP